MSGRGSSGFGTPCRALRATRLLGLLTGALATSEAVRRLVTPPLQGLVDAVAAGGRAWDQPLAPLLASCCAAALALAWAWLLLCGALVAVDTLRQHPPAGVAAGAPLPRRLGCPAWVRTLVLVTLGATVGAGPALADAPSAPVDAAAAAPGIAGLRLPDRVAASASSLVRVHAGDTLWAIAAHRLPAAATDAAVDRAWRRLAAANTDRVGDPDLIFPGTVLRVPDLDRPTRKEPS